MEVETTRDVGEVLYDFLHTEMVNVLSEEGDDQKEQVHFKLERIGFSVGQCLVERYTRDLPRMHDQLDIIKFICKDFWVNIFHKQIDNLRTNHRGVYVLQDHKFRLFTSISTGTQYIDHMSPFLAMPCGLIRGALAAMGLVCTVHADVVQMPA
eukprot:Ihof_evm9s143 gene=Ihof_evmTU9s143